MLRVTALVLLVLFGSAASAATNGTIIANRGSTTTTTTAAPPPAVIVLIPQAVPTTTTTETPRVIGTGFNTAANSGAVANNTKEGVGKAYAYSAADNQNGGGSYGPPPYEHPPPQNYGGAPPPPYEQQPLPQSYELPPPYEQPQQPYEQPPQHRRHHNRYEEVSPRPLLPEVKPYFDTYYCSVHGSFALAFNEKVETTPAYESVASPENYGSSSNYPVGSNSKGSGGEGGGYAGTETKFVRKITRQYCRYTASWSYRACQFCCRVVARSAYTNPDDIQAAIFTFDPVDPSAGGAGVEVPVQQSKSVVDYTPAHSYGPPPPPPPPQQSYNGGGRYAEQQGGSDGKAYNGPSYGGSPPPPPPPQYGGHGGPPSRHQQPHHQQSYGNEPPPPPMYTSQQSYREKRSAPYTPSSAAGTQSYENAPEGYGSSQSSYDNGKAVSQCVCCAPKHRYY